MATDYVLFIHGVDVRKSDYADSLIGLIKILADLFVW